MYPTGLFESTDVADNMDMSRIPNPTEKDYERLREYTKVREILRGRNVG